MYSAKASTMKVPLHQKRAGTMQNQSWSSMSGHSTQTQTESKTQTSNKSRTEVSQSNVHSETKYRTQTHAETKVQRQTTTQTRQQSQIQTKNQMWSQTQYQSQNQTRTYSQDRTQTTSQEDQRAQEEKTIKRAESLTNDFRETAVAPCEPLLFGHMFVREQLTPDCHHQTNGFTLSRPRDFISAVTKERDSQSSTAPGDPPLASLGDASAVRVEASSYDPRRPSADPSQTSSRRQSSGLCCSSSYSRSTPIVNGEVYSSPEEAEKRERSELGGRRPVYSVREDSTCVNITNQPANSEPNISAPSIPQWDMSKDGHVQDKQDLPAAQDKHAPECGILSTDVTSAPAGPGYLIRTGVTDGEASPGELVLIIASAHAQAPTEHHRSTGPDLREQAQRETPHLVEGGATTGGVSVASKKDESEQTTFSDSPQTQMILQGSAVVFTEDTSHCRSPGDLLTPLHPSQVSSRTETPEDHQAPSPWSSLQTSESNLARPRPASVQSVDCLPTFTSQRPQHLPSAISKQAPPNSRSREPDQQDSRCPNSPPFSSLPPGSRPSSRPSSLMERTNPAFGTAGEDAELPTAPSAFRPSLRHRSPSPVKALPSSSVRAPPCSSPFRVVPASSPTTVSAEDTSLNTVSRAPPCFSSTPSSVRGTSVQAPPAFSSSPFPAFTPSSSSSGRSSSIRAGPPSSPTLPSSVRSPPCSSPIASSSAFTRSLAASCISQSISQSMAKKNNALQQPVNAVNQSPSSTPSLPSSHLRQRSPSPKLPPSQQGSGTPAYAQLGCAKDGYQHPRGPSSSPWSSCPSPSLMQSPTLSQRSPSPSMILPHSSPSPRPSFLHSKSDSSQNANNNNNNNNTMHNHAISNGCWSVGPQNAPLANGNATVMQQTHDPLWTGSHNRVARPFSASEPSSRVQSPSPSPTPTSFTRLCSPPPQHNYSSPMANKPPHPRSTRVGGASSHNPLGLTLELPKTSSVQSYLSPQILSPPPIGVSVNVWTNNVAAPQPRNPRQASSSASPSFSSSTGSPTLENATSSSFLRSSRASSPSASSQATLRRSFSSNLADRPPSPVRTPSGLRRSWVESNRRSLGFSGRASFDQQESCPTSPRSGWSSYCSSPSCLSPRAGIQSPLSPSRLTPGKGSAGGQHFTSVPWPDVRELSNKYNGTDSLDASTASTIITSSPSPLSSLSHTLLSSPVSSHGQTEWGDLELEEGNCRSQLICAYVARPSCEQNLSSSCMVLSSSGVASPPPAPFQNHNYQSTPPPVPTVPSPLPSSSPLPFALSSPTKQGNQKTSYATTVNLQIAGSGRITSFSTAQVSLTQTLQGGSGGPGQGQMTRRVSINGLSHLPPPLSQNCHRL
ncbi:mucin-5AC-like [Plectropomus leopardus]|uniref:mucin-5AC-like n=1 Tax=Plectropomus leopardus TaxID=160734 RepID=UPI001C4BB44F|nr:mucin-5AC-like [Plectropomus leopardus]